MSINSCQSLSIWKMRKVPFFFFNDTATTEIYTLSLHDALPIFTPSPEQLAEGAGVVEGQREGETGERGGRSEEHTSELQSRLHLVCRLLLEKKKKLYRRPGHAKPALQPRTSTRARYTRPGSART